ncbi:uncharacterized protein LOC112166122 [Rosa chinensis]|uniref:uncharacterized protein LOC112166122 n=1 Tax=Rosa chinensis TaxID=74649 RepID=UPI000D08C916|nr:uncharacterized protein LOC112166122 [Rosa chinensis]
MALILLILFEFPLRKMMLTRLDELNDGNGRVFVEIVAITVLGVFFISCVHQFIMMMINRFLLEFTLLATSLFLALVIQRLLQIRKLETEIKQLENEIRTKKNDDLNTPTAPPYSCAESEGNSAPIPPYSYAESKGNSSHIQLKHPRQTDRSQNW